jgi:hypothetical protein
MTSTPGVNSGFPAFSGSEPSISSLSAKAKIPIESYDFYSLFMQQ